MNTFYNFFYTTLLLLFLHTSFSQTPDTTINRYATAEDANYWSSVNEGDYIFFKGNIRDGAAIYAGGTVFHVNLPVGKKILIWQGNYERILIDGQYCESTEANPTIVTNLGGQVRWGESYLANNKRTLELFNFDYLYLTGKYDETLQTGHEDFLGHDNGANYSDPEYYKKYGLWGNPKWSGDRTESNFSNVIRIHGFKELKLSYVAATEGGFAGFNIKSDNPSDPERVIVDIQDCFAGWLESEGFYISYSTSAENQDLTELTFKNNIMVFCGAESLQTDNLTEGTSIANNVAFTGACFFRRPFQDNFQDGLHQFSFVEGGVTVENNVMMVGNSLHQMRFKDPGTGRAFPDVSKKVVMTNNYYGYSRTNITYIWEGDGITPYVVNGNFYGPVSVPSSRDAYLNEEGWSEFFRICNTQTDITLENLTYPSGKLLFDQNQCGTSQVTSINNTEAVAPLVEFHNSGFSKDQDYRNITFWSATYGTADKEGVYIPYEVDDIVFYYDTDGNTKFFKCIQDHEGDFDPNTSTTYWKQLLWNGNAMPPLDLRLLNGNFYELKDMGLTYKAPVLSVTEVKDEKELKIFPNPAQELVTVALPNQRVYEGELTITDLAGRLIRSMNIAPSIRSIEVSTMSLPKGVYFINFNNEEKKYSYRLIVR